MNACTVYLYNYMILHFELCYNLEGKHSQLCDKKKIIRINCCLLMFQVAHIEMKLN